MGNVSAAFYSKGGMPEGIWNNYPELADARLWITLTDLARFYITLQKAYQSTDNILLPVSSSEFTDRDSGRTITFEIDESGIVTGFIYEGTYPFKRIKR